MGCSENSDSVVTASKSNSNYTSLYPCMTEKSFLQKGAMLVILLDIAKWIAECHLRFRKADTMLLLVDEILRAIPREGHLIILTM